MQRAIVTVGLGFGDEGKGATVDHLTRALGADLVIRYCGGAQAGHNVQLEDGRRHTFAQFGAGTLAGAGTFLGEHVVISPAAMRPEAEHLRELGVSDPWSRMSAHSQCLVATWLHQLANRLRETARGERRHGSCGMGIGEARHYWLRHGEDAVFAADLLDRPRLREKLGLLRERLLLDLEQLPRRDSALWHQLYEALPDLEADSLRRAAEPLAINPRVPACETAVFEGAQGVLLDERHGCHPYTTWSTVTPRHAWEMLLPHKEAHVTVLGITRAYSTRHGAGPFPTFCRRMTREIVDPGNPENAWQGAIRSGPLDLVLLEYAARVANIDALAVNCLDQLPPLPRTARICRSYEGLSRIDLPSGLDDQQRLTGLLENARPSIDGCSEDELLHSISRVAPLASLARGPTVVDRELTPVLAKPPVLAHAR